MIPKSLGVDTRSLLKELLRPGMLALSLELAKVLEECLRLELKKKKAAARLPHSKVFPVQNYSLALNGRPALFGAGTIWLFEWRALGESA
jgi:hypothetical protein